MKDPGSAKFRSCPLLKENEKNAGYSGNVWQNGKNGFKTYGFTPFISEINHGRKD
jgi:hypothetical protein